MEDDRIDNKKLLIARSNKEYKKIYGQVVKCGSHLIIQDLKL